MNIYFKKYFILKTNSAYIQFFRYLFVGGIATVADAGIFYILINLFLAHYLIAQTAGFLAGLTLNYLISIAWVFKSSGNLKKEFSLFAIIGIGGLLLSYGILYLLIDILNLYYFQFMLSKMTAIIIVLFWNFGMRKKFVF
jgi:putative flippase GtrA